MATHLAPVSVNDSATSVTLLAANSGRLGLWVFNDSSSDLYIGLGATPTTSSYHIKVPTQSLWECPQPCFQGVVNGIWSADSSGAAKITEVV